MILHGQDRFEPQCSKVRNETSQQSLHFSSIVRFNRAVFVAEDLNSSYLLPREMAPITRFPVPHAIELEDSVVSIEETSVAHDITIAIVQPHCRRDLSFSAIHLRIFVTHRPMFWQPVEESSVASLQSKHMTLACFLRKAFRIG